MIYILMVDDHRGKTLILLEDVDILSEDDKGFWACLLSIIQTTKCPIILTCTGRTGVNNNSNRIPTHHSKSSNLQQ